MDPFTPPELEVPVIDPNKNYLEELVGEGKKYKTVEDLARSRIEADNFIERLKQENSGIRTDLQARTTMQQFLEKLEQSSQQPPPNNQQESTEDNRQPYNPEELEALVEQVFTKKSQETQRQANYRQVTETLAEHFGTDAPRIVQQKANELGMDLNTLKQMAEQTPKAFLTLVGATGQRQPSEAELFSAPPPSQINSGARTVVTGERTESYYNKIRDANPGQYWSPSVQNQLHKDAVRLGARFFDT